MNAMKKRNTFLLILTAFIWGVAFVAQSEGGKVVGPYTFNFLRFIIGGIVLIPVIFLLDRLGLTKNKPVSKADRRALLTGGISCGIVLCIASNLQQLGLFYGSTAGKAGFLTACYILLVPILGLFLKKTCGWNIWIGVIITLIGLYLLCMNGSFSLQLADILLLLCALFFSVHILVIDHFSPIVDGVRMSCIQFLVAGILSAIPMFASDMQHSLAGMQAWVLTLGSFSAWIAVLYAGVLSCGVAYTLQIIGQKGLNPTVASLLMSLESVFSVLAGWVILHETMSRRELFGCVLIFAAVVLAQIPVKPLRRVS
jgi:drug/metabolite transporter (DMT)-like permease